MLIPLSHPPQFNPFKHFAGDSLDRDKEYSLGEIKSIDRKIKQNRFSKHYPRSRTNVTRIEEIQAGSDEIRPTALIEELLV